MDAVNTDMQIEDSALHSASSIDTDGPFDLAHNQESDRIREHKLLLLHLENNR